MFYDDGMKLAPILSLIGLRATGKAAEFLESNEDGAALRVVGWTSVALGIAAIGLYVGHELRSRYKFRRRTPYDIFAHAGEGVPAADYGMGI